jgi:hypothetical protein
MVVTGVSFKGAGHSGQRTENFRYWPERLGHSGQGRY